MGEDTIIRQRFRSSIRRGTGEANLIMQSHPDFDFSTDIIKASLTNFAYDGQSENSRALYLSELIALSGQPDRIRYAILKGLETEQEDTWSLVQLFELAKVFAEHGDTAAREAIYNRFFNHPVDGSDWSGYTQILELDGITGLKFIAEKIGRTIEHDAANWQDDSIILEFQENNPQFKVMEELEIASVENRYIKIYLDRVKETVANAIKTEVPEYKNIIEEALLSKPYIRLFRRELREEELRLLAQRLINVSSRKDQEKLLFVFTHFKYPFDSGIILQFARQKPASANKIAEFAVNALKFLKSDAIRAFALEKIQTTKSPEIFTKILISNYKKGDSKMLTELVGKFNNEHIIENLACSYIDIYRANKTRECKEPLEAIYAKLTCSLHRNGIVKVLIANKVLSEQLKEEIKFDCDQQTRQFAEQVSDLVLSH